MKNIGNNALCLRRLGLLSVIFALTFAVTTTPGAGKATNVLSAGKYPAVVPKKKKEEPKSAGKKDEKKEEKKKFDDEKSFADVIKDMEVVKGLFTFYRKVDEGKTFMEIGA